MCADTFPSESFTKGIKHSPRKFTVVSCHKLSRGELSEWLTSWRRTVVQRESWLTYYPFACMHGSLRLICKKASNRRKSRRRHNYRQKWAVYDWGNSGIFGSKGKNMLASVSATAGSELMVYIGLGKGGIYHGRPVQPFIPLD